MRPSVSLLVCRSIGDHVLGGRSGGVRAVEARFSGVVFPGETLRTAVWVSSDRILFATQVVDREGAPALTGGEIVLAPAAS